MKLAIRDRILPDDDEDLADGRRDSDDLEGSDESRVTKDL